MSKRIFSILIACCALAFLFGCTVRKPIEETETLDGTVQEEVKTEKEKKKDKKKSKEESAPASGTDLRIAEPLSDAASCALSDAQEKIAADGSFCGLIFLGYLPGGETLADSVVSSGLLDEQKITENYPFVPEITASRCAEQGFTELYCLVPGENTESIRAYCMRMNEDGEPSDEKIGELLSVDGNGPVLLSCDSNGWGQSNLLVTLTDTQGKEYSLCPAILANLGELAPAEGVSDLTQYPEKAEN